MNNDAERRDDAVVQFVRSGAVPMPEAVDARLLERLHAARGSGPAASVLHQGRRWLAAAILLAGIAVTAAVLWTQRAAEVPAAPPESPPQPAPQEAPEQPAPQEPAGPPLAVVIDATTTVQKAELLLVVEVSFPSGVLAKDGYRGKVLRVIKGPAELAGQSVWLAWNTAADRPSERSFLDNADLAEPGQGATGAAWLLALEPQGQHDGRPQLRGMSHSKLGATRVSKEAQARLSAAGPLGAVQAELLAALYDPEGQVRAAAMAALCNWDGSRGGVPGADSPWRDPANALKLLARHQDPEPAVRVHLAGSVPLLAGQSGRAVLDRLLFDRLALVRWSALASLQRFPLPEWWQDLRIPDPISWCEFTSPQGLREWSWRAEAKARSEGITTRVGAFERQLQKDDPRNQLLGALGLGTTGDAAALPLLQGLANHADGHVRAAAAASRIKLGDRTAHAELRALVSGEDLTGAVCALDMLRGLGSREALDVVDGATRDPRRLVRAMAAAGLRDLRDVAQHLVDARLQDLQQDKEEMVRIAAGGR